MIAFRSPWYFFGLGVAVCIAASLIPTTEPMKWPAFLAGGLLLMEGGLGLRTLPQLVPFASFPEDWREIEREFYFGKIGKIRLSVALLACTGLAVAGSALQPGDWEIWSVVAPMLVFAIGWVLAALKVIREVLGNNS